MNKTIVEVGEIRSYQTLVYKNGNRTFRTSDYKAYERELWFGIRNLRRIPPRLPIRCYLTFNIAGGVLQEQWRVKMLDTNNTSRVFDSKEEAIKYHDPNKHYIERSPVEVRYGVVGDNDNIEKPILDYMEKLDIITNDRLIVQTISNKTFGNEKNTIEIELKILEPYENNGRIEFKEK